MPELHYYQVVTMRALLQIIWIKFRFLGLLGEGWGQGNGANFGPVPWRTSMLSVLVAFENAQRVMRTTLKWRA